MRPSICSHCGQPMPVRDPPPFDLNLGFVSESLFRILWNANGDWVTRHALAFEVWGSQGASDGNVRANIHNLRRRIAEFGITIETHPRTGSGARWRIKSG